MKFIQLLFLLLIIQSCSGPSTNGGKDEGKEYSKVELSYAKGFEIYKSNDGNKTKIVLLDLEKEGQVLDTYFLSSSSENQETGKNHFNVPLGDISIASTTHSAFLISLGLEENIKGMSWAQYAHDAILKEQIANGITKNISGAEEVDLEKLVSTGSKAFTNYPFALGDLDKFKSINMPLIIVSEYLEETPLARAEWIKFFGVFYNEEKKANEIFYEIEKKYLNLKTKAAFKSFMPKVLIGSEQNGVWHMPGGESLIATFIKDAGGQYLFSDFKGKNNQQVDMEVLLKRAEEVNFWGKITNVDISLNKLGEASEKLKSLKAIEDGNVFYCNTTTSDYFGAAVMEPELILSDMISIFHPTLLPNHKAQYFIISEK